MRGATSFMEHHIRTLTAEDLARLSQEEGKVVYQETHDHTFEPWDVDEVEKCASRMYEITHELKQDTVAIRARIDADCTLKRFANDHPTLASKLSDYRFCNDKRILSTLMAMFKQRKLMVTGQITEEEARNRVSAAALRLGLPKDHPIQHERRE